MFEVLNSLPNSLTSQISPPLHFAPTSVYGSAAEMQNGEKLPFLFEVEDKNGNMLYDFVLPISPENYDFQWQPRANVTLTQGGLFQDVIGVAPPKIVMGGTFGYAGNTVIGAAAKSLRGKGFCSLDMYLEMETMLLDFYTMYGEFSELKGSGIAADLAATNYLPMKTQPGNKGRILFFNFTDRHYYEVQIDNFKLTRSTQRKHLYQYAIQMTCIRSIDTATGDSYKILSSLALADATTAASNISKLAGLLNTVYSGMYSVVSAAEKLKGYMNEISTGVATFKNAITTLVHVPFDVIQSARTSLDSIIDSMISINNLPHEVINDLRDTKRLLFSYEKQKELFVSATVGLVSKPTIPPVNEILSVTITPAMKAIGYSAPGIPEETLYTETDTVGLMAAQQQVITASDTIYTVAAKNGVDWKQIATINNMESPYTLTAGSVILIPGTDTGQVTVTAKSLADFEERMFLVDEKLDEDGFMVAENGSTGIAKGSTNLVMQLKHRLATQRGEMAELGHIDYGCNIPNYIGKPNTDIWIRRAMLEFKNTMLADNRIASVGNIGTQVIDTSIYMVAKVYPNGQTASIEVSHPFA